MADNTTNYNLVKPNENDFYDIKVFNNNMDVIDTKLKEFEGVNEHKNMSVLNNDGAHDFKYDKVENKFKYKETESWHDINLETEQISTHISNTSNPHNVTKAQVGLSNVDNTSDLNKPISNIQREEFNKYALKYSDYIVIGTQSEHYGRENVDVYVENNEDVAFILSRLLESDKPPSKIIFKAGRYTFGHFNNLSYYYNNRFTNDRLFIIGEHRETVLFDGAGFFINTNEISNTIIYFNIENLSIYSPCALNIVKSGPPRIGNMEVYVENCKIVAKNRETVFKITQYQSETKYSRIFINNNLIFGNVEINSSGCIIKGNLFGSLNPQHNSIESKLVINSFTKNSIVTDNYFESLYNIENNVTSSNNIIANNLFCS